MYSYLLKITRLDSDILLEARHYHRLSDPGFFQITAYEAVTSVRV